MAAVTTEAPPQLGKALLTLHPHAPTPPVSSPAPLFSVSPPCQHQLPIHAAPVAPGSHSSPVPQHAAPHLASACNPVLDQTAGHHTTTHQQHTASVCQTPIVQQASAEDHPSNNASSVFSQQELSSGATTGQGLHPTTTDSPVIITTDLSHGAATAAVAAEAEQHVSGRGSGTGRPIMQATRSQADANKASISAEQKCQASRPVALIRDTDETDAQQLLSSGFTTGTGKQVTVTIHGKTRAADMLGRNTSAEIEPEGLPVIMSHAPSAAEGRSPGYEAPAAVASGFTTGAGKPVIVTARAQAEARKLFGNAAPEDPGDNPPKPLPADGVARLPSGFITGTGKAVLTSTAAKTHADKVLATGSSAAEPATEASSEPPSRAAVASSGFTTGFTTGTVKAVLTSTAAQAQAAHILANDSTADDQSTAAVLEPSSAAAIAPSGFSTGTGKAVLTSASAMARARKVLADDSTATLEAQLPSISTAATATAPSGFGTGTGKAVLTSAAAMARAQKVLADNSMAAEQPTEVVSEPHCAAAVAPSGFSTGAGKIVLTSAAAMARAQKVLANDSTAAEQPTGSASEPPNAAAPAVAPSGFSTGTGKAVQFSTAAMAWAQRVLADDSTAAEQTTGAASGPTSAAAPTPAPSGFTSGTGKSVPISAAAQAQARSMFQDENAAPMHTPTDMDSGNTPSARPLVGTPRTGPPISKPVTKRVKELSQSTGGKLFKKPRMSKIVSPFCPGAAPHRVRLDCD